MVVALGIGQDGCKTVLGLRQGATENATVVGELLGDLVSRGLEFSEPRLYILDGGKALHAALERHAGKAALIQFNGARCTSAEMWLIICRTIRNHWSRRN